MNQRGVTLIRLLVSVLLVAGVLAVAFLLVSREQARARDAKRIADMSRLQAAFELLFADRGSYEDAAVGCGRVGVAASSCTLLKYFQTISALRDPSGGPYLVSVVPSKSAYGVRFTLERSYDGLARGPHTLGPNGID